MEIVYLYTWLIFILELDTCELNYFKKLMFVLEQYFLSEKRPNPTYILFIPTDLLDTI